MTSAQSTELEGPPEERSEALPEGTRLLGDQFTIKKQIGKGGFGITYLAEDSFLDRTVVIKECFPEVFCHRAGKSVLVRSTANHDKYRSIVDMFMREARSIAKLRHPNIIGVHRVFEDNDTAYMALDLIEGRDLLDIIKNDSQTLTPDQIRNMLHKLLDAVDVVHQQDLLHRDISPDNILIDKWGNPVLIDFGAAREEASRETRALSAVLIVKDGYSPQEFYFSGGKQTPSSDLYALAATFYHLISGVVPPNSQTRMAEVAGGGEDPCEPLDGRFDDYAPEFLQAIDRAMRVLPKERLQSARDWMDMLDPNKKRPSPLVLSQKNDLSKTLTRLVSETNEYVLKSEPRKAEPQKPPKAEPVVSIPDWVREFNEETSQTLPPTDQKAPAARDRAPAPSSSDEISHDLDEDEYLEADDAPSGRRLSLPSGLRSKFWRRMNKIRASWMVILLAIVIVQHDPSGVANLAVALLQ